MSLQDFANLGEAVSGLAVVVTLIYLTFQIRQNTRAIRASTYQDVVDSIADLNTTLAQNDELMRIWVNGTRDGLDSLSDAERSRFGFVLLSLLRQAENIHYQQVQGTLEPEAWAGIRRSFGDVLKTAGVGAWWKENAFRFNAIFRRYVESEIVA